MIIKHSKFDSFTMKSKQYCPEREIYEDCLNNIKIEKRTYYYDDIFEMNKKLEEMKRLYTMPLSNILKPLDFSIV